MRTLSRMTVARSRQITAKGKQRRTGAIPGKYRVLISRLIGPDGTPVVLGRYSTGERRGVSRSRLVSRTMRSD